MATLKSNRRGIAAIEYALLAALIAVALFGVFQTFKGKVEGVFTRVGTKLDSAKAE